MYIEGGSTAPRELARVRRVSVTLAPTVFESSLLMMMIFAFLRVGEVGAVFADRVQTADARILQRRDGFVTRSRWGMQALRWVLFRVCTLVLGAAKVVWNVHVESKVTRETFLDATKWVQTRGVVTSTRYPLPYLAEALGWDKY